MKRALVELPIKTILLLEEDNEIKPVFLLGGKYTVRFEPHSLVDNSRAATYIKVVCGTNGTEDVEAYCNTAELLNLCKVLRELD